MIFICMVIWGRVLTSSWIPYQGKLKSPSSWFCILGPGSGLCHALAKGMSLDWHRGMEDEAPWEHYFSLSTGRTEEGISQKLRSRTAFLHLSRTRNAHASLIVGRVGS